MFLTVCSINQMNGCQAESVIYLEYQAKLEKSVSNRSTKFYLYRLDTTEQVLYWRCTARLFFKIGSMADIITCVACQLLIQIHRD